MSAIDQVLTGYGWQVGDLEQARAEIAALRATIEAQSNQLHEAYVLLTAINFVAQNDDIEKWLAANAPAAQEQTT